MKPEVHESCFIHPTATIVGKVTIGANCGIWPSAVIRGDESSIEIGEGSNIQDCCVVHVTEGFPTKIGKNVSVGHGSIIHGAIIENDVIIGMGAVVLNGAVVAEGSIIGAGALVKEGVQIPPGSLVVGIPGKVIREGDETLRAEALRNAKNYQQLAQKHKAGDFASY